MTLLLSAVKEALPVLHDPSLIHSAAEARAFRLGHLHHEDSGLAQRARRIDGLADRGRALDGALRLDAVFPR